MLFYILSTIIFTLLLLCYIFKTRKWIYLFIIVVFLIVFTLIFIYSLKIRPYSLRGTSSYLNDVLIFLLMCIGMISNQIFKKIRHEKFKLNLLEILKPLFISPIIFLFIWGALEKMEDYSLITYCFAFQNGFFWQVILEKVNLNMSNKNNQIVT